MNITNSTNGVSGASPVQKLVQQPIQKEIAADAPKSTPMTDRVELGGMSELLKTLKSGGDVRADKVAAVKAQIEAGTYEDEQKLDIAADRLLDDLLK
jgi:anti-sigma28 factor (negative regulator of flagellin synthesis)